MTMHKALHPETTLTVNVSRKEGEKDLLALKTVLMDRYNDSGTT